MVFSADWGPAGLIFGFLGVWLPWGNVGQFGVFVWLRLLVPAVWGRLSSTSAVACVWGFLFSVGWVRLCWFGLGVWPCALVFLGRRLLFVCVSVFLLRPY